MNVKDILQREPPPLLFHYTTQNGLLGIVCHQEIWASHTQYLNDRREFRHALSLVEEELVAMKAGIATGDNTGDLLDDMQKGLSGVESINVCVCSFSEEGDMLSQWRAYGGGASGFSIGFSGAFLRGVSNHQDFWLVPCLYQETEQRELVRTLLDDVLRENRARGRAETDDNYPPGGNLVAYLNRYAPILKHQSFSEEREWRIISRPLPCSGERFAYRAGTSMLIPYYRIPLSANDLDFQIERVVIGPTPHKTQSRRSVQGLLVRHRLKKTKVHNSATPYRNW